MIRRRFVRPTTNVSLFPFLAVLVCTMGALIVLLVLVVHQARVQADTVSEKEQEQLEKQRVAREDNAWRREILEQQRAALITRMANKRMELGHLEDHIRRLEDQVKQLAQRARDAETSSNMSSEELERLRGNLQEMQRALAQAQRDLEDEKKKLSEKPPAYAIVPYRGAQGTFRRPIYIECLEGRLIVRPGDLELTQKDLNGPQGPGNPLDAALRAIREYWARTSGVERAGEPYPLLIVRPEGTDAYVGARNALKAWDDEFGYELVGKDMNIEFPAADPHLRQHLKEVLKVARKRQELLVSAMPSKYGGGPTPGLVARSHGGFATAPGYRAGAGAGREVGRGIGRGHQRGGFGQGTHLSSESGSDVRSTSRSPNNDSATPGRRNRSANRTSNAQAHSATPGREAAADGQAEGTGARGSGKPGASGNGSGAGVSPLANRRGANWALPKSSGNAIAVTRPIRVVCALDRLTVLPDPGSAARARTVEFDGATVTRVDEFTSVLWEHMDRWGIAITGGYWKPIVKVEVVAGAEQRFLELQRLMEGSGIEVQRRSP